MHQLRDPAQVQALIAQIEHDHGRLDLLVNNAWGGHGRVVPAFEL